MLHLLLKARVTDEAEKKLEVDSRLRSREDSCVETFSRMTKKGEYYTY